ncbi:hypothetical protein CLOM_g20751 [Closterium sp. NIES-68]|nr:hypothetical protein CLOM_g20751 [Closterium sp. NIES-68]
MAAEVGRAGGATGGGRGEAEQQRALIHVAAPPRVSRRRSRSDDVTEKKLVAVSQVLALLPISLFPKVTTVHEVTANTTLFDAIKLLSRHNLTTEPGEEVGGEMEEAEEEEEEEWEPQYLGMMDLAGAVILWVFANLEASSIGFATASTVAASLVGSFVAAAGAAALEASAGPAAAAPAAGAVGMAALGGHAATGEGAPGESAAAMASSPRTGCYFFEELLKNEAFHATRVADLAGSFRWSPFVYLKPSDTLLTLFLLMSKYAIRSVPVLPPGVGSSISTVITQSAAVGFLCECDGMPWFNSIADCTLAQLGLPSCSLKSWSRWRRTQQ